MLCTQNNPQGSKSPPPLIQSLQREGTYPGEDWQVGFTQLPPCKGYKYFLVFVDAFTGWIEAYPPRTER